MMRFRQISAEIYKRRLKTFNSPVVRLREEISADDDDAVDPGTTEQKSIEGGGYVNESSRDCIESAVVFEPRANEGNETRSTYSISTWFSRFSQWSTFDDDDTKDCGCWTFRPLFLSRFRTAEWLLFWLCWAGALQGMVVNGLVNAVLSTIERRFGLRSVITGLIAGGYDIGSFVCLIPLTFLGGRVSASKPVWLSGGVLILGFGSLIFASPHFFLESPYHDFSSPQHSALCLDNSTTGENGCADSEARMGAAIKLSHWLNVFLLGQLVHGMGASPLYTLGVTFIDESVSKKMSSIYLGIFYTATTIGPPAGYLLGCQLLNTYPGVGSVDVTIMGITPQSGVWIGAWWIGFISSAILCLIIALPLFAFPPSLPGATILQAEKICEAHFGGHGDGNIGGDGALASGNIRGLPSSFRTLVANPTFSFLSLASALEGMLISALAAFLPKIIESQFGVDAGRAAFLIGLTTVLAGGGATFLGGYLVKRFNLKCSCIIILCVISTAFGFLFTCGFLLNCLEAPLAGISLPYKSTINSQQFGSASDFLNNWSSANFSLNHDCNAGCGCTENDYNPICGADGLLYYSPCYAGCSSEKSVEGVVGYTGCECIMPNGHNLSISFPNGNIKEFGGEALMAINQLCQTPCNLLWPFMVITFLVMCFTFLSTVPALLATLRCVESSQRSFALGIQWMTIRLLGTISAPMIFGALIDKTCLLWQETSSTCGETIIEKTACRHYDNILMGRYIMAFGFTEKALALISFYLAWWFYIPPSSGNNKKEAEDIASFENDEISLTPCTEL